MKSFVSRIPIPVRKAVVLYVFDKRVWIARATRTRGSWTIDQWDEVLHKAGENWGLIGEKLRGISNAGRTAVVLILSREFYNTTRAAYPVGISDHLQRVIEYEKEEHTLHRDIDEVVMFRDYEPLKSGQTDSVLARILWAEKSSYGKILQLLPLESFAGWVILPDVLLVEAFAKEVDLEEGWILIPCDDELFGAYHLGRGNVTESALVGPDGSASRRIFKSKAVAAGQVVCVSRPITGTEAGVIDSGEFFEKGLERLLSRTTINGFEGSVRLGFPRVPRSLIPVGILLVLVIGYGLMLDYRMGMAERELRHLLKEKQSLEEQWKPIEANLKTIEELAEDRNSLNQIMKQNIPVGKLFEELSEITPEDTWLNYFDLSAGNTVMLRGESNSAVEYVAILSRVPGFKEVSFVAPVRKNSRTGKELFSIRFVVDWSEFSKATD